CVREDYDYDEALDYYAMDYW
nr:immunoglobulin heavy chain junction region [Mus musculus]MBK4189647.1 immunoglobulin heavy chain junction region [Mus musculus]